MDGGKRFAQCHLQYTVVTNTEELNLLPRDRPPWLNEGETAHCHKKQFWK